MDENTLQRILTFQGDIRSSLDLLLQEYGNLKINLKTNLLAVSSPFETFGNTVRNYRSKGLISPVVKSGVKLILDGRNLLQYLLVQRFLAVGSKIKDLIEFIPSLDDNQLIDLIQKNTLNLSASPLLSSKSTKQHLSTNSTVSSSVPVWYHIKVDQGIHLQINANQYSVDDVEKIRNALRSALDELQ